MNPADEMRMQSTLQFINPTPVQWVNGMFSIKLAVCHINLKTMAIVTAQT